MLAYGRSLCDLWEAFGTVTDRRRLPVIPAGRAARAVLVMTLTRLGSLNALEQTRGDPGWRRLLGAPMPSADTVARVFSGLDLAALRTINGEVYRQLKRKKAIQPPWHGLMALVVDGHESHATFRRHCEGCLSRTIHLVDGDRVQYYHRHVAAMLVGGEIPLLLDAEPVRPGEDEVAAALRLVARTIEHYPRAFDLVDADGLYARADFFNAVADLGKYVLAVLKDEQRDLMEDLRGLLPSGKPVSMEVAGGTAEVWDMEGFTTWPQVKRPVRVVRSVETKRIRRQLTGQVEEKTSEWVWVMTLPRSVAPTRAAVQIGHSRWMIENEGFNETVNEWHGDHVYTHDDHAMLAFWLVMALAYNLFHAFWRRNLKPAVRARFTMRHIARTIAADLYAGLGRLRLDALPP